MYEVRLSKSAAKYIQKLDRITKERIKHSLLILAENPRDTNLDVKRLHGYQHSFRLRIGKYRVLYKLFDNEVVILVFDVDSRGDVYKR